MTELTLQQVNGRIDKMATWAAEMQKALRPQMVDTTELEKESHTLYAEYSGINEQIKQATAALLEQQEQLIEIEQAIEPIEDNAMMEVTSMMKGAKLKYTNDTARKTAVRQMLREDSKHNGLIIGKTALENEIKRSRATINHLESELKMYGKRNSLYVARLNLAAAKVQYLKETEKHE